jgi:hypothetical protein
LNALLSMLGSLIWGTAMYGSTVTIAEPLTSAEGESRSGATFRRNENGDELSTQNLGNLLRQLTNPPMGEIANLISELQTLRKKLQTDGDRIQRDIAEHAELSQQVMQLTTIISDSVKKLPRASSINQ